MSSCFVYVYLSMWGEYSLRACGCMSLGMCECIRSFRVLFVTFQNMILAEFCDVACMSLLSVWEVNFLYMYFVSIGCLSS